MSILTLTPDAPIGVFDSGMGGLSVLREIRNQLPQENLHYLADSAFAPYGNRSEAEIRIRSEEIATYLFNLGCKALVIACNTATAAAVSVLRERWPERIIVAMEPAVKPAVNASRNGVIGVIATSATLASHRYAALLERHAGQARVVEQACPGLVELVEQGEWSSQEAKQLLRGYLKPLLDADMDRLVLGCTHYPFLRPLIASLVGADVEIIDTGPAVAGELARRLASRQLLAPAGGATGQLHIATTGDPQRVAPIVAQLWGEALVVNHCAALTA